MNTTSKIILRQCRGIFVESINKITQLEDALAIRSIAYDCFDSIEDAFDVHDLQSNTKIFLARNSNGVVVGSARCIDAYAGVIELDKFLDVCDYAETKDRNFFEVTRLSVVKNSVGFSAKMMLCKAILEYAISLERKGLVLWTKDNYKKDYEYLLFKYLENDAFFLHPRISNQKHTLMYMNISNAKKEYNQLEHDFSNFFFEKNELDCNIKLK